MFSIVIEDNLFVSSIKNFITTTIYIKTDKGDFPDAEWTDFAVQVLSWWCEAAYTLHGQENAQIRVSFIDGDFSILCKKTGGQLVIDMLEGFDWNEYHSECKMSVTIGFMEFVGELQNACASLRMLLERKELTDVADYEEFLRAAKKLNQPKR